MATELPVVTTDPKYWHAGCYVEEICAKPQFLNFISEVKSNVQSCKDDLGMNVHLLVETIASLGANFSVARANLGMIGKLSKVTPEIMVAKDGIGDVETNREAIRRALLGITTAVIAYIKSGIYNEHIVIPDLPKFRFVGENWQTTIIQGELY
nr:pectinesterase/pectinesterase inhibitor u1 [Quercus suber]